MPTSPVSESKPKSRKLLVAISIIALAVVLLIAVAPWVLDYFSASEKNTSDSDNDGVPDELDAFPHDPSKWADNNQPPPVDPFEPFL